MGQMFTLNICYASVLEADFSATRKSRPRVREDHDLRRSPWIDSGFGERAQRFCYVQDERETVVNLLSTYSAYCIVCSQLISYF
jgi:hypothetical protein